MAEVEKDNIEPPPHYIGHGVSQVVTSDSARQGPWGNRVLVVLSAGLVLAGIAFIVIAYTVH